MFPVCACASIVAPTNVLRIASTITKVSYPILAQYGEYCCCWLLYTLHYDTIYHFNPFPLHLSGKGAAVLAEGLSGAVSSGLGKVRYLN